MTQYKRANTLWHPGQRLGDALRLEAAVRRWRVYDRASEVYTREAWPEDWAEMTRRREAVLHDLHTDAQTTHRRIIEEEAVAARQRWNRERDHPPAQLSLCRLWTKCLQALANRKCFVSQ